MSPPHSKLVADWINEQSSAYPDYFSDWIYEQAYATIWFEHERASEGDLWSAYEFGVAAKGRKHFKVDLDSTVYLFLGEEQKMLGHLKREWQKEFESDDPPLTPEEFESDWKRREKQRKIEQLERELEQLKGGS